MYGAFECASIDDIVAALSHHDTHLRCSEIQNPLYLDLYVYGASLHVHQYGISNTRYMVQIYIYDTFPLLGAGNAGARAGAASAGRLLSRGHCAGGAPLELLSVFLM